MIRATRWSPALIGSGLLLTGMLFLGGCLGGSSSGNGNDEDPPEGLEPTLSSIQSNVFTPTCTGCHSGSAAPEGLRLESGQSHSHLVEVNSQQTDLYRVEPGNPDDSYLIHKLEGTHAVGDRMPQGGPFLSQSDINVIRQWIEDGAEAASSAPQPTTAGMASSGVTMGWPMEGSSVGEPPGSVILIFDQELDASRVHADSIRLFRFDDSDPSNTRLQPVEGVELRISTLAPTTTVLMELPASLWQPGHYKVQIMGSGATPLATRGGQLIDGDGDGKPGGDFSAWFELRASR